jgi:hypothetical protein
MKEIPPWLIPILFSVVGGFVLGFVVSLARARAKSLREDKDPKNDWQADVWDAIADAAAKGDLDKVRALMANRKK